MFFDTWFDSPISSLHFPGELTDPVPSATSSSKLIVNYSEDFVVPDDLASSTTEDGGDVVVTAKRIYRLSV